MSDRSKGGRYQNRNLTSGEKFGEASFLILPRGRCSTSLKIQERRWPRRKTCQQIAHMRGDPMGLRNVKRGLSKSIESVICMVGAAANTLFSKEAGLSVSTS